MTSADIIDALFHEDFAVTVARVRKAQKLAQRGRIEWAEILAALTDDQRQQIIQAS